MRFREEKCNIDFDVFGYRVQVIFTTDLQRSRNGYDKIIGQPYDVTGAGALHTAKDENSDHTSYIFFKWYACAEQIAHESWHAVRRMLLYVHADFENEVVAYHLGHLVGNIHSFQKHIHTKKRRKK